MGSGSAWLSTGIDTGTCIRCCNSENLNFCLQSNVIYMYIPLISPDKVKIYHCLKQHLPNKQMLNQKGRPVFWQTILMAAMFSFPCILYHKLYGL